jgi:hypothetical protein
MTRRIGVDLGTSSLKLFDGSQCILREIPWKKREDLNFKRELLKETLKSQNLPLSSHFYLSFKGLPWSIHRLKLPRMSLRELTQALELQPKAYLGSAVNFKNLGYRVKLISKTHREMEILLITFPKEVPRTILEALQFLNPLSLELDFITLVNYYLSLGLSEEVVSLLEVGATHTTLLLLFQKNLIQGTSFNIGGDRLTSFIQEATGSEFEKAEELKKNILSHPEVEPAREKFFQLLSSQVRRYLEHWSKQFPQFSFNQLEKIYLAGGTAKLAGMKEALEIALGIRVELLLEQPQEVIPRGLVIPARKKRLRVNLKQPSLRVLFPLRHLEKLLAALAIIILSFSIIIYLKTIDYKSKVKILSASPHFTSPVSQHLIKGSQLLKQIKHHQTSWRKVLAVLSQKLPPQTELTYCFSSEAKIKMGKAIKRVHILNLAGRSENASSITQFIKVLERENFVVKVSCDKIEQKGQYVNFSLKVIIDFTQA